MTDRVSRIPQALRARPHLLVGLVLLVALALRLLWLAYTHHASDDAFITFRFALNLARGDGFTYNPGERVYGTTTPLLTLLLAAWRLTTGADIVLGAHAIGLVASLGSLLLLALILRVERIPLAARLLTLAVLAISSKVLLLDMQGMEMPLAICLMMGAWLSYACGRHGLAGILAGCLLWVRVDLALWPAALVIVEGWTDRKRAAEIAVFAGLTYLPWVVFAGLYFGSPIPHTLVAKSIAYGIGRGPILEPLTTVLGYLSPFNWQLPSRLPDLAAGCLTAGLAAWHLTRPGRTKAFSMLAVFATLELAGLVLARATFFTRYLYPLLWAVFIPACLGAVSLWRAASQRLPRRVWIAAGACLLLGATLLVQTIQVAGRIRATQRYRNEASLQAIGEWLAGRGPAGASVLLEPLGYVGYYSGMRMIDEVGLVSPGVVALKLREVPVEAYFAVFWPDYLVEHCDDAGRFDQAQAESGVRFADHYAREATFDPSGLGSAGAVGEVGIVGLERSACYVVWERVGGPP